VQSRIAKQYTKLIESLTPADVDTIWSAILFGRRHTLPVHLRSIAADIERLREDACRR